MKWLLLLTILSGYSGSSTATANFDSKEAFEAAGKSHDQAIRGLHWHRSPLCGHVARQPTPDRYH